LSELSDYGIKLSCVYGFVLLEQFYNKCQLFAIFVLHDSVTGR